MPNVPLISSGISSSFWGGSCSLRTISIQRFSIPCICVCSFCKRLFLSKMWNLLFPLIYFLLENDIKILNSSSFSLSLSLSRFLFLENTVCTQRDAHFESKAHFVRILGSDDKAIEETRHLDNQVDLS